MKRIIVTLSMVLSLYHQVYSQEFERVGDKKTFTETIDSIIQFIDKQAVTTGILYDRVYPFAGLNDFNATKPDTSNYNHFIQSFSELRRASNTLNQH